MAKNFVFKSGDGKITFRANELELALAKKAYSSHNCEPINGNVTLLQCKNCKQNLSKLITDQNVYCTFDYKYNSEEPNFINKLCLSTCDENIIKKLIE